MKASLNKCPECKTNMLITDACSDPEGFRNDLYCPQCNTYRGSRKWGFTRPEKACEVHGNRYRNECSWCVLDRLVRAARSAMKVLRELPEDKERVAVLKDLEIALGPYKGDATDAGE